MVLHVRKYEHPKKEDETNKKRHYVPTSYNQPYNTGALIKTWNAGPGFARGLLIFCEKGAYDTINTFM